MEPIEIFEDIINEIEKLDIEFRENGIPERYKKKWRIDVNVGLWIIGRKTAEWLHKLVLQKKPKLILELGTSVGYSALWLGRAAVRYGGVLETIDKEKFKVDEARTYIEKAKLQKTVTCIEGDIFEFLKNAKLEAKKYDFVFIDAGKREYVQYLKLLEPILADSSTIVADNMSDFAEQTKDYREYLSSNHHYKNQAIEIDHGLMLSIYKE